MQGVHARPAARIIISVFRPGVCLCWLHGCMVSRGLAGLSILGVDVSRAIRLIRHSLATSRGCFVGESSCIGKKLAYHSSTRLVLLL